MVHKILKNRPQDNPKSPSEESRSKKQEKCKNEQPSIVFGTFLLSVGSKILQNSLKSGVENEIKIKCDSEVDFSRIFDDFGVTLGSKIVQKSKKNGIQKQSDF
jgi:hypothetical protein